MKSLALIITSLLALTAHAESFNCLTDDEDLSVTVYNHVHAGLGTRSAAAMVVSDPRISQPNKTVAVFSAKNNTLYSARQEAGRLTFIGQVDLRYKDSARKGEYLLGTRLGDVDTLTLDVLYNYADVAGETQNIRSAITVVKRNGETAMAYASCSRKLKGE